MLMMEISKFTKIEKTFTFHIIINCIQTAFQYMSFILHVHTFEKEMIKVTIIAIFQKY